MKKALFIIALALCGQGLQAASEPFFSVKSSVSSWGMPEETIKVGPFKYKLNPHRLAGYVTLGCMSAHVNHGNEWQSNMAEAAKLTPSRNENEDILAPLHHVNPSIKAHLVKEFAAEFIADVMYDSINMKKVSSDWTINNLAEYALHSALYNVTRNAMDGFQKPRLYFPIFQWVCGEIV